MTPIPTTGAPLETAPKLFITFNTLPSDRVQDASIGIFKQLKETFSSCWDAVVSFFHSIYICIKDSYTVATFVFFRALDTLSPTISSTLERGYLYIVNFLNNYSSQQRELSLREKNTSLRTANENLQNLIQQVVNDRDAVRLQRDQAQNQMRLVAIDITFLRQANARLTEDTQRLTRQIEIEQENIAHLSQEKALIQAQVAIVRQQLQPLQQQIAALRGENGALRNQADTATRGLTAAISATRRDHNLEGETSSITSRPFWIRPL